MDFALSEDQRAVKALAAQFVEREVAPHAMQWDRDEALDRAIVGKLAEVGFLGAALPERYGGGGLDSVAYCLILEELGRGDSSVRGVVSVSVGLFAKPVLKWGTDAQREAWLPRIAAGESVGCFALTEPGSGSDPGSMTTRARRDGSDYVIDGSKMFITNGTWADIALVFARTSDEGGRGVSAFLVPTATLGFTSRPIKGKLGLRAQDTAEIALEGVRVSQADRLGEEGDGLKIALDTLDGGRMSLAAGCVGIAEGALAASLRYAGERRQFGRPIASFQLIQELIADIAVDTQAARLLTWHVATLADAGEKHTLQSSYAKYFASEAAVRAANAALQVHGGYGYIDEYPVGKYLRDARVTTLYEGTSQIQKLLIGRRLTGENAFT